MPQGTPNDGVAGVRSPSAVQAALAGARWRRAEETPRRDARRQGVPGGRSIVVSHRDQGFEQRAAPTAARAGPAQPPDGVDITGPGRDRRFHAAIGDPAAQAYVHRPQRPSGTVAGRPCPGRPPSPEGWRRTREAPRLTSSAAVAAETRCVTGRRCSTPTASMTEPSGATRTRTPSTRSGPSMTKGRRALRRAPPLRARPTRSSRVVS